MADATVVVAVGKPVMAVGTFASGVPVGVNVGGDAVGASGIVAITWVDGTDRVV